MRTRHPRETLAPDRKMGGVAVRMAVKVVVLSSSQRLGGMAVRPGFPETLRSRSPPEGARKKSWASLLGYSGESDSLHPGSTAPGGGTGAFL